MHILHLDTGRELRGGQRQLLLLARGLQRRSHSQVILTRRNGAIYEECLRWNLPVMPIGPTRVALEARRADLIHAHDARSHTLAALVAAGRPLIVSRRVAFPVRAGPASRWKYERASRFLAVSEFVKQCLMEAGVPCAKISVVYDGVELPQQVESFPRSRVVLAPAVNDPQKGNALAAGLDIKFSRDLASDLPRAAAFLYLSHNEGLGSAILLAMAHRTPVIASRVGGIPEIVRHRETGLLVQNEPAEIAAAVREVLDNPVAARGRAEAAYAQVRARFTDAIMVAQTEQAYEMVIRSSS